MKEEVTIVVVPFPAQGHLNQLLHFSLRLASLGFPVHFATSPSHIRQAKERIHGWNSTSLQNVHFHDLHSALPIPSPPPDPNSTSKFPNHLIPAFHASLDLQPPLRSLLLSLSPSCRRLVVIHDPIVSFAGREAADIPNAESYRFQCVPAFIELPYVLGPNSNLTDKLNPEMLDVIAPDLFEGSMTNEALGFFGSLDFEPREAGTLFNTCRAIEGEFFDILAGMPRHHGRKLFDIGPLNPTSTSLITDKRRHPCLEWLDKQPPGSVVYVSFGSMTTLSDSQVEQLAVGLKTCGQRFLWSLRDADRGDNYAAADGENGRRLPVGFEEETVEMGRVVRKWAPQLEILAHPSMGAFVSHCGWNSCMESLSFGVPVIAWPMHSDQPRNAVMIARYLKAGIIVREWERREEVISGEEIAEVIERMMVSEEGNEVRKRAKSIGEEARLAVSEGGSSKADLDSFVAHIRR